MEMNRSILFITISFYLIFVNGIFSLPLEIRNNSSENYRFENGINPQQIHISLGDDISQIVVTWSTFVITDSIVRYGIGNYNMVNRGTLKNLSNGINHVQYIHRAVMDRLLPKTTYVYQVGSEKHGNFSRSYSFTTLPAGENWTPRFCVYGDLGLINAQSLTRISADVEKQMYDVIIHVGDFAYDLDSDFGDVGDKFMRLLEPIAARVPYMTTPGNHEKHNNFSNYKIRFNMPRNDNQNMFYSYTVGPARIISISTEFYIYVYYGVVQLLNQYQWLVRELKTAALPENRARFPWIILLGHRPMYCSNIDGYGCTISAYLIRYGFPPRHGFGIEDLLYETGVDLAIWAHEHTYERMWPVYNEKVVNSSTPGQPYHNPKATVHIVSGSAGCQERHSKFSKDGQTYSAYRSTDYGYSRMTIYNTTHLYFEQISDDQKGKVIDSIWLTKTKHGPFENMN